ncbi:M24 family metallopeptidase [Tessaracoccus sp. MC1756]|uniref:M24 family metallopeptidase n=1 Tax=Tessaracoccus sp. MC1756 TaxID=2760311 RepID=UPI001601FAE0|nr:M24 family metallopeptidase [Tessaracoccus sp. MC1756]MBB1508413.1 aminopeptidase P family protein [Tessaracoccus sp. MC1756]
MNNDVSSTRLRQPKHAIQSFAERDARWTALSQAAIDEGYDVLLFAAADYRGHKGSVRYISGYNPCHRYGYAVMFPGEEPKVVLPQNLEADRRPDHDWVSEYLTPYNLGRGLAEVLGSKGDSPHIGIIGLRQVMKVEDYLAITELLPRAKISDAGQMFSRIRAIKSPAEQLAVRESAYILDACFDRLLEIARPGLTEQQIAAEMFKIGSELGGQDPLFLTMFAEIKGNTGRATFGQPEDRILGVNDVFTFSYEIVGPNGYWTELSRMVTFAKPTSAVSEIADAVAAGIDAAQQALVPATAFSDVQRAVISAVEARGAKSEYWSGHGMGLDVLEEPWIGLDVVGDDADAGAVTKAADGQVLALHPTLWNEEFQSMGYMSDSFIIVDGHAEKLSKHPTQIHQIS